MIRQQDGVTILQAHPVDLVLHVPVRIHVVNVLAVVLVLSGCGMLLVTEQDLRGVIGERTVHDHAGTGIKDLLQLAAVLVWREYMDTSAGPETLHVVNVHVADVVGVSFDKQHLIKLKLAGIEFLSQLGRLVENGNLLPDILQARLHWLHGDELAKGLFGWRRGINLNLSGARIGACMAVDESELHRRSLHRLFKRDSLRTMTGLEASLGGRLGVVVEVDFAGLECLHRVACPRIVDDLRYIRRSVPCHGQHDSIRMPAALCRPFLAVAVSQTGLRYDAVRHEFPHVASIELRRGRDRRLSRQVLRLLLRGDCRQSRPHYQGEQYGS